MSEHRAQSALGTTVLALMVCAAGALSGEQADSVSVKSVEKVYISKDVGAYLVSYSYDFDGKERVYVEGLGVVPAKGMYHHLVQGEQLAFWDADKRTLLKRASLMPTVSVAATPPLNDVPRNDEFPSSYRSFPWLASQSLQERVNVVLGKYFNYLPRDDNRITYISTTYTPLQLSSDMARRGVTAQVSLLLSFPHEVAGDKYMFRVHVLPKEGRMLSNETRGTANENIVGAANKFVDNLVVELSR